jgi:hypothetical protein
MKTPMMMDLEKKETDRKMTGQVTGRMDQETGRMDQVTEKMDQVTGTRMKKTTRSRLWEW